MIDSFPLDARNPMGLQLDDHIYQMWLDQTFRPYVEDWENRDEVPEYDLEGISSVPISLIVSSEDQVCLAEYADVLSRRLSTLEGYTIVDGADHELVYDGTSDDLFWLLAGELDLDAPAVHQTIQIKKHATDEDTDGHDSDSDDEDHEGGMDIFHDVFGWDDGASNLATVAVPVLLATLTLGLY